MSREFASDSMEWMIYVSRREWQLLYSLSFAAQAEDIVPGGVTATGSLDQLMRWAARYLQEDCGYIFDALHIASDGRFVAQTDEPIEKGNVNWLAQLSIAATGAPGYTPPRYEIHLPVAIDYAKQRVPNHARIVEMMDSALRQLTEVLKQVRETRPDPETREAIRAGLAAARETLMKQTVN